MPNIIGKIKDIRALIENLDVLLEENEIDKAQETINQTLKEIHSLEYDTNSLRSRIKIAGRNLTEAFEQLLEPAEEVE